MWFCNRKRHFPLTFFITFFYAISAVSIINKTTISLLFSSLKKPRYHSTKAEVRIFFFFRIHPIILDYKAFFLFENFWIGNVYEDWKQNMVCFSSTDINEFYLMLLWYGFAMLQQGNLGYHHYLCFWYALQRKSIHY